MKAKEKSYGRSAVSLGHEWSPPSFHCTGNMANNMVYFINSTFLANTDFRIVNLRSEEGCQKRIKLLWRGEAGHR